MGLFEILFPKIKQKIRADNYFQTLSAYTPTFRTWNGELYESELVRTAIDARSRHIAKFLWFRTEQACNEIEASAEHHADMVSVHI